MEHADQTADTEKGAKPNRSTYLEGVYAIPMSAIIPKQPDTWLSQKQPWVRLASFIVTVIVATVQQWSAKDIIWSFWLVGLTLGTVHILINQVYETIRKSSEAEQSLLFTITAALRSLAGILFVFWFAYLLFAMFIDTVMVFAALDTGTSELTPLFTTLPATFTHVLVQRWPFLLASWISFLPSYVRDALTVELTDFTKPVFAKDLFRMIVLIFILVPMTLLGLGIFALYPVLLIYFLPWNSVRQIIKQICKKTTCN